MHDNYVVSSKQDILLFLTKRTGLKGTVHPKMNIRSSFTHPHVVPNLKDFPSSVEHQRCLKKCFGPYNRKSTGDNVAKKQCCLVSNFLHKVHRRKKFIQIWSNMRVSKWQNFNVWVNYAFNFLTNEPWKANIMWLHLWLFSLEQFTAKLYN